MTSPPVERSSLSRIQTHLNRIACLRDPFENRKNLLTVQHYIESELYSYGYMVKKDFFEFEREEFSNIIAGRIKPDKTPRFIIGAHFDAVPGTPGADDNASGVAALLEAARCLAHSPANQYTEFVAFNLEEYNMAGSKAYARKLKKKKIPVLGMISLEMIGYVSHEKGSQKIPLPLKPFYPSTGDFIALVGDGQSKQLLKQAEMAFKKIPGLNSEALTVPMRGILLPEVRLSDHSPFWDEGYPALLITDTSFFRNPNYHSPQDTLDTLDVAFIQKVTDAVIQLASTIT